VRSESMGSSRCRCQSKSEVGEAIVAETRHTRIAMSMAVASARLVPARAIRISVTSKSSLGSALAKASTCSPTSARTPLVPVSWDL